MRLVWLRNPRRQDGVLVVRQIKFDGMILATLICTTFYSTSYPFIHKQIMYYASDNLIALNQIINCVSIVLFGFIWNKTKRLFNFYPALCIIEGMLSIGSTIFAITTHNIVAYYIIDTLIFSIVTRNICCGGIKLRAMRYNTEEQRERYDNNNNSANAIGTIVGSCLAMILDLNFEVMLIIATIGNTVDNIFYICIYYNERKKISESKINKGGVS